MGDVLAIQSLLKMVSQAINDGARINKKIANYLSKAFIQIYYGEKADLALGIVRSRGEKSTRLSRQRAFSLAFLLRKLKRVLWRKSLNWQLLNLIFLMRVQRKHGKKLYRSEKNSCIK